MERYRLIVIRLFLSAIVFASALTPCGLWACACGCGVFEVGTATMFPTRSGGTVFLEQDYVNQNRNWNRDSAGLAADNSDKQIRTRFYTAGIHYMFNRRWGILAELPYWSRYFEMTDDDGGVEAFSHSAFGDMRISGVYSGLLPDMSTGVTLGLKLPTGDFRYPHFDRDVQIGTGSTDLLLGGYHMGHIADVDHWNWFANAQLDLVTLIAGGYRPGSETNAGAGFYYDRWKIGDMKVSPVAQVIASHRWRDAGVLGNSRASGYERVLLSPGMELNAAGYRLYADIGFPVYQYVNGDQLAAATLFKLRVGYAF